MIAIRSTSELDLIKRSGAILKHCFLELEKLVKPGVTTAELDRVAEAIIFSHDAVPAF